MRLDGAQDELYRLDLCFRQTPAGVTLRGTGDELHIASRRTHATT